MDGNIRTYRQNDIFVVEVLTDSLDIFNYTDIAPQCAAATRDVRDPQIVMDLSRIQYIDSIGVSMLMRLKRRFGEQGMRLSITGLSEGVLQVFDLLNVQQEFDIVPGI